MPEEQAQKSSKKKKITAFEIAALVRSQHNFKMLNKQLYIFRPEKSAYSVVTKEYLQNIILLEYYNIVEQVGSLNIVKSAAELVLRYPYPPDVFANQATQHKTKLFMYDTPAHENNILCLQDGFINLSDINEACFYSYQSTYHPYNTYCIAANGSFYCRSNWANMKSLPCPWMDQFINSISDGNTLLADRIWQMLGYLLTPDNQKFFFLLQGQPNSGKSVLGNLIRALYPIEQIENLDIDQLGKRTATSRLIDKSINISMDLPNKPLSPLAIRNIKLITGNDDITVEYGNGSYRSCHIYCRFLFATNHPLTLNGIDPAFENRIVCIPFSKSVSSQNQNPKLLQNLLNEKDAIVAKALAYYRDLRLNNYQFAGTSFPMFNADIKYLPTAAEDLNAHLCEFVDEECEIGLCDDNRTYTSDLYDAYRKFCTEKGYTPINDTAAFSRSLNKCYGDQIKKARWRNGNENQNGFTGIILKGAPIIFRV